MEEETAPTPPSVTTQQPEISFACALFTLSDWSGPASIGNWYGRSHPWRRILAFAAISSWSWTANILYQVYVSPSQSSSSYAEDDLLSVLGQIPILQARTRAEIEAMKLAHQDCFSSLCEEVGRSTAITCIVNDDGVTSRVEYGDDIVDPFVDFPEACHVATEVTFGDRYLDGFTFEDESREDVAAIAFISLSKITSENLNETTTSKRASLLTLLPDCSLMISDPDVSPAELQALKEKLNLKVGGNWNDLYQDFQEQTQQQQPLDVSLSFDLMQLVHLYKTPPPGHRETNVLKYLFCVDEMPEDVRQAALPTLTWIYNFLMDYRQEILTVLLYFANLSFAFLTIAWLMLRLVVPSMLMKRVLSWPDGISTTHIWNALLVLCLVTSFRLIQSPVLAGFMACGALWYRNFTAAMEWSFLGILAWAASDTIYPYLDDVLLGQLEKFDGLDILYWTTHIFVIGEGWWKLVTIYVVYRAYQALYESTQQPPAPIQQTQMNLHPSNTMNGQEQQQQQDHFKVD